jgi:hypothetical protein
MTILMEKLKFNIQDGPQVTLPKKIEYIHYHSSKRADVFINNRGMFKLFIHKDMLIETLCVKYHY